MRRHRNVKIVATLGPASSDYDTIRALHEAGADVFRLNMSHGEHADIAERHRIIRQIEEDLNKFLETTPCEIHHVLQSESGDHVTVTIFYVLDLSRDS